MKKVVSVMMAAVMAFSLAGCGSSNNAADTTAAPTQAAPEQTEASADGGADS